MAIYTVLIEYTYEPVGADGLPIPGAAATWVPGQTLKYPGTAFPTRIPIGLLTEGKAATLKEMP